MTMIVGCAFDDCAVLVADSRATLGYHTPQQEFHDALQKIVPLSRCLALGYTGSVNVAERVIKEVRVAVKKNPRLGTTRRMFQALPRIARDLCKSKSMPPEFIVAGFDSSGKVEMRSFRPPNYAPKPINRNFDAMGSGEVVKTVLGKNFADIASLPTAKQKADALIIELQAELGQQYTTTEDTVGGMLQAVIIFPNSICPLTHGSVRIDPEGPRFAKKMTMCAGQWVQIDLANEREVPLHEPSQYLLKHGRAERFHDFRPSTADYSIRKCHLNYFLTSAGFELGVTLTRFTNTSPAFLTPVYPAELEFCSSFGLWGPAGDHQWRLQLDSGSECTTLHEATFNNAFSPEQIEFHMSCKVSIPRPGLYFVELIVDGALLGRRPLHAVAPHPGEAWNKACERVSKEHQHSRYHLKCKDQKLTAEGPFISYFSPCQTYAEVERVMTFGGEFKAVFWKTYPLKLKLHFPVQFRAPPGEHLLEIELMNCTTGKSTIVGKSKVTSEVECWDIHILGELVAVVPEVGSYFFNLKIDGQLLSSVFFFADSVKPFSYSLPRESVQQIQNGQLLLLSKRAQTVGDEAAPVTGQIS